MVYVPGKLIVHGKAAATASNISASEPLFRLGIAAQLISQAGLIFVVLALYDLLKGVNQRHALLMVTLVVDLTGTPRHAVEQAIGAKLSREDIEMP